MKKALVIIVMILLNLQIKGQSASTLQDTVKTYTEVDVAPSFLGGISQFSNYINVLSMQLLNTGNLIGPVYAQFVIQKDGRLINPIISSHFGKKADTAIISIFRHSPFWTPGLKGGLRVATLMKVTLNFVSPMNCKPVNNADYRFAPAETVAVKVTIDEPNPENSIDPNKIYNNYEKAPEFPGGAEKFILYLKQNFNLPPNSNNINGRIILSFVVEINGTLTNVKVERGLSSEINKEALRVIREGPKWHPGIWNSKPVRVAFLTHIDVPINP